MFTLPLLLAAGLATGGLINLLIFALVLLLVWYVVGMFAPGKPAQIIGLVLAIIFLIYALKVLGVMDM